MCLTGGWQDVLDWWMAGCASLVDGRVCFIGRWQDVLHW